MEYFEEKVVIVPICEETVIVESLPEINHSIKDVLDFIADRPINDQVCMLCNLLTINGFSQKEISESIGFKYKTYRNHLWTIRKEYLDDARKKF